jgi:uncharacterized protein (DUF2336 family)
MALMILIALAQLGLTFYNVMLVGQVLVERQTATQSIRSIEHQAVQAMFRAAGPLPGDGGKIDESAAA